ncbi:putative muscarinic acetylcholine receptor [Trichinella pseudospiralis]
MLPNLIAAIGQMMLKQLDEANMIIANRGKLIVIDMTDVGSIARVCCKKVFTGFFAHFRRSDDSMTSPLTGSHLTIANLSTAELAIVDQSKPYPILLVAFLWFLTVIFSVETILGNLLVLIAYRLERTIRMQLSSYFIVSLAISDLIIGMEGFPLLTMYVVERERWPLGQTMCQIWLCLDYTLCLVSIFTVLLITVDRYCSVCYPAKYRHWQTAFKVKTMVCVSWLLPAALFTIMIFGWHSFTNTTPTPTEKCYVPFLNDPYVNMSLYIAYYWTILIAMSVLYRGIHQAAKQLEERNAARHHRTVALMLGQRCMAQVSVGLYFHADPQSLHSVGMHGAHNANDEKANKNAHAKRPMLSTPKVIITPSVRQEDEDRDAVSVQLPPDDCTKESSWPSAEERSSCPLLLGTTGCSAREKLSAKVENVKDCSDVYDPFSFIEDFDFERRISDASDIITDNPIHIQAPHVDCNESSSEEDKPAKQSSDTDSGDDLKTDDDDDDDDDDNGSSLPRHHSLNSLDSSTSKNSHNEQQAVAMNFNVNGKYLNVPKCYNLATSKPSSESAKGNSLQSSCKEEGHVTEARLSRAGSASKANRWLTTLFTNPTSLLMKKRKVTRAEKRARRAFRTITVIVGAFALFWSPYYIVATVYGFCHDCVPNALFTTSYYLCYLNSSFNPFAYAFANRAFRRTFIRVLRGDFRRT